MDSVTQLGDWKKISVLGSGAFGVVVLLKNEVTAEFVAIKLCKFSLGSSLTDKQRQRWQNEVQIMKSIHHDNIIKYKQIPDDLEHAISVYNPTKLPLLSMEYCSKGNLRYVLQEPRNISGLNEVDVRFLLTDIRNGLEYLHSKNITHRDIKPDNIVLQNCNERKTDTIYKIIDLGYAKELNGGKVSFVGTLDYLAPEIFRTENYTKCVDYWSFGVLTFEAICGVLPFLPGATPYERFEIIRRKKPDDIYIYKSNSGQVVYSSDLKKENHISSSLAENIKYWLRRVLNYDANERAKLTNNRTNLDCLKTILDKHIVQVFYVYKLELYSYEYNEYTLLSTVKDWVSRDVNVNKTDLLLMINEEMFGVDDDIVLNEIFHDLKTPIMYVMRRDDFVNLNFNIPKLVKEIAHGKQFNGSLSKQFNMQIIHFITNEKSVLIMFQNSFKLYTKYTRFLTDTVQEKFQEISTVLTNIIINIQCYNKLRLKNICDIKFKCTPDFKDCLNCFQRLTSSLERALIYLNVLNKKVMTINKRQVLLDKSYGCVEKAFSKWNISVMYENVMKLYEKNGIKRINTLITIKELIKIVSEITKGKMNMFYDQNLLHYVNVMEVVINSSNAILLWMNEFLKHVNDLSNAFDRNEINYHNIVIKCAIINNSVLNNNVELCNKSAQELIQLNRNTRSVFSGKIEEFHNMLRKTIEEINFLQL